MKVAAIIAEYNPFHQGHSYQISETRRITGADYVLVIMSGNFVQRGAPAICNKYVRTKMALLGGADAVIELPSLYAVSSAEYFAQGAVTLLENLQTVDFLSFGSECGDLSRLAAVASRLVSEDSAYQSALSSFLRKGCSFPEARAKALTSLDENNAELLASPNNILGIEYCKSLLASHSQIRPFTVKRSGSDYHDSALANPEGDFSSASAIRRAACASFSCDKSDASEGIDFESIKAHMPSACFAPFQAEILSASPITEDDFSSLLHYKLLSEMGNGFSEYLDCTPDLSDKICSNLPSYIGFSDFCEKLKSKDVTYTRLSRVLLHILLGIKTPDTYLTPFTQRALYVPYARLLGFREGASALLKKIKQKSRIPLLSKLADAETLLTKEGYAFLKQDLFCASVYEAAVCAKKRGTALNEFRQSPIHMKGHTIHD